MSENWGTNDGSDRVDINKVKFSYQMCRNPGICCVRRYMKKDSRGEN
jgi:hypothetical protein